MSVPRLLVLTDRVQAAEAGRDVVATAEAALRAGAPAVVLREKDLPAAERRALAVALAARVAAHRGSLIVAGDPELAAAVGAAGVHLAAGDPPARDRGLLVGRSCHDPAEVAVARSECAAYATVSPVASTASKPGHGPALGERGLAGLVGTAGDLPVLALGGVTPANAGRWCAAGAHGVAVMGAVMRADDPERTVAQLLAELAQEEP